MSQKDSPPKKPASKPERVFRSPAQEAYLRTQLAASHLSRQVDQLLRSFEISQPQYNVLRILAGAPAEGLGRNEIADRMLTATPDMTRLLSRMEDKGWIRREREGANRREVPTTLTRDGASLLKRVEKPLDKLHQAQFARLNADGATSFIALLRLLEDTKNPC